MIAKKHYSVNFGEGDTPIVIPVPCSQRARCVENCDLGHLSVGRPDADLSSVRDIPCHEGVGQTQAQHISGFAVVRFQHR